MIRPPGGTPPSPDRPRRDHSLCTQTYTKRFFIFFFIFYFTDLFKKSSESYAYAVCAGELCDQGDIVWG